MRDFDRWFFPTNSVISAKDGLWSALSPRLLRRSGHTYAVPNRRWAVWGVWRIIGDARSFGAGAHRCDSLTQLKHGFIWVRFRGTQSGNCGLGMHEKSVISTSHRSSRDSRRSSCQSDESRGKPEAEWRVVHPDWWPDLAWHQNSGEIRDKRDKECELCRGSVPFRFNKCCPFWGILPLVKSDESRVTSLNQAETVIGCRHEAQKASSTKPGENANAHWQDSGRRRSTAGFDLWT